MKRSNPNDTSGPHAPEGHDTPLLRLMFPHSDRTIGVDEAGRGPVLGPMVLAVAVVDEARAKALAAAGVQDSKRFGAGPRAQTRRAALAQEIRDTCLGFAIEIVAPATIDEWTFEGRLNELERVTARALLERVGATTSDAIVCDGARLFSPLSKVYPRLVAVDDGESAHPSVAAASILAKVTRDEALAAILDKYRPEFGPIAGGGYPNAATQRFLDAYKARHGELPEEARKSWGAKALS